MRHVRNDLEDFERVLGEAPPRVDPFRTGFGDNLGTSDFAAEVHQVMEAEVQISRFLVDRGDPRRIAPEQLGVP